MRFPITIIATFLVAISCNDNGKYLNEEHVILSNQLNLPETPYDYTPKISDGVKISFPELAESLNPDVTRNHQATMGRVIFYDKRLSKNNSTSCASCHIQERAFADNTRVSKGFDGVEGHRNTLALAVTPGFEVSYGGINVDGNVAFPSAFFSWDDSAFDLTEQSLRAITSEIEMGMTMNEVVQRLSVDTTYAILAFNAFETSNIMEHHILEALRVFINSMSAVDTRFDEGLMLTGGNPFTDFPNYLTSENNGKRIFNRDCASCHHELHTISLVATANNGIAISSDDQGKGDITNLDFHMGVFKVPFLRNIELTGPYMHDGRFESLSEVVDHYSENIQDHPNLNSNLKNVDGSPKKFNYSASEKEDIIAYLKTLTDLKILEDPKFSNPFK